MPIDITHSVDPEDRERDKFVKKALGVVTASQNKLKGLSRYFDMPKIQALLGRIDPQIIRSNPEQQTDFLTRLPKEIGAEVWKQLHEPADRLMLALTCKFNAGMFEDLKVVKDQPMVRKKATGAKAASTKASAKPQGVHKQTRYHTLAKGTRTDTMAVLRRLQPWMRSDHDLCYVCTRYVSKTATADVRDFKERGGWGGKFFPPTDPPGQKKTTLKELEIQGRRCPVCVVRKHLLCKKDTAAFKETARKLEKMKEWFD